MQRVSVASSLWLLLVSLLSCRERLWMEDGVRTYMLNQLSIFLDKRGVGSQDFEFNLLLLITQTVNNEHTS